MRNPCSFPKIVTAGLACDLERMLEKVLSSKVWRAKARSKFSFISLCSKTTENMCSPLQPLQCSSPDVKKQLHSDSCKLTHPYQTLTPCLRSHLPAAASTIESCSQEWSQVSHTTTIRCHSLPSHSVRTVLGAVVRKKESEREQIPGLTLVSKRALSLMLLCLSLPVCVGCTCHI